MNSFSAKIFKIGVNPYVLLPAAVLKAIFKQANKDKGPIPVRGELNGYLFSQTLVKFSGKWRLYLNTPMRKGAGIDVGDKAEVKIEFDPRVREISMHPKLKVALEKNKKANQTFLQLPPSRKKEIMRYIGHLKAEESVDKNVKKAILFLTGKERFVGREKP
jgi:hypothetical protein